MVLKTNIWLKCVLLLTFWYFTAFYVSKNGTITLIQAFQAWRTFTSHQANLAKANLLGTCFICKGFAINESQLLNGILFKEKCDWNRLLYFVIQWKQEKCLILSTFLCIFLKIPIYCYKREYNIEICIHVMTL